MTAILLVKIVGFVVVFVAAALLVSGAGQSIGQSTTTVVQSSLTRKPQFE